MAFASSSRIGGKTQDADRPTKDGDATQGRFSNIRRVGENDGERFREGRNANPLRRRNESGDGDAEGWSTVKPRKSFGAEGAERFQGRMGGNFRDDKRTPRDRDDRTPKPFDGFSRERDGDEEGRPRNTTGKKLEPWNKTEASEPHTGPAPEKRERMDRAKSWRERDPTSQPLEERGNDRNNARWAGRDQRHEREPEWLDEPVEPKTEAKTQQDFQKWMEEMKRLKGDGPPSTKPSVGPVPEAPFDAAKPAVQSAPAVEIGPDKFFMAFGAKTGMEASTPTDQEGQAPRSKPSGKSSRFTSFFAQPQEAMPAMPPMMQQKPEPTLPIMSPPVGGGIFPPGFGAPPGAPDEEKQAFQQLLAKLQKQSVSATPPQPSPFPAPSQGSHGEVSKKTSIASSSPFQLFQGGERRDGPVGRPPAQQHHQEIHAPRPQQQARPEQLLQDLVGHHQRVSSQGSTRAEPARNNSNAEFLMNLMRGGPDTRSDSALMRAHHQHQQQQQQQQQRQAAQFDEREQFSPQENRGPPRNIPPPPGFPMSDSFPGGDGEPRQSQPTQILQRPHPPPGLDQMPPNWMNAGQVPPPHQQRQQPPQQHSQPQTPQQQQPPRGGPMLPPPGLAGGPGRSMPPPHMFPPNFPPGAMPPPDMGNMPPPRHIGPPPPGFFGNMPPGFIPPPGLPGFNGPPGGPDSPHGFGGNPFERGMPPPGAHGRGASFGRG